MISVVEKKVKLNCNNWISMQCIFRTCSGFVRVSKSTRYFGPLLNHTLCSTNITGYSYISQLDFMERSYYFL